MASVYLSGSKVWAAALVALALSACASQQPPPPSPTAAQIASTAAEIATANVNPADYASIGITLAGQGCANWFSQQTLQAGQAKFGTQALSMLGGIAAAAGGPAGTGAAMGASALANLLGAYQAASPAGVTPASVYGLVERVQQAWLAAMPVPLSTADAYALVEAYSEQCSLPAIQNAVAQALNSVPVTAQASAPAPTDLLPPNAASVREPTPHIQPSHRANRRTTQRRQTSEYKASDHLQDEWSAVQRDGRAMVERRIAIPQVCIGCR